MTCEDIVDDIEPIAAGDLAPRAEVSAHLATCAGCAAALDEARRLDGLLRARPAAPAPAQFTSRTMQLIRRASWRREQIVDWIFNAAMIAAALLTATGVWMAFRRSGLPAVSREAMDILGAGLTTMAQRMSPSLPLYAGATCVIAAALGVWWWAERGAAL